MGDVAMSSAAEAERAFAICDQNSDGKISQEELAFFLRALGQNPTNADVKQLPDDVDFSTAFQYYEETKKEPESAAHIEELFRVWDKEGNGVISFDDLAQCLKIFGSATQDNFVDQEIEHLKKEAGVEGNVFKYKEFLDLMVSTQQPHLKASLDDTWPKGAATQYK